MKRILYTLALVLVCTYDLQSQTSIDCSTSAAVIAAFTAASSNDTLLCNAAGHTYNLSVTTPSTKNITWNGNGNTFSGIAISSNANFQTRLTNMRFSSANAISTTGDALQNKPWRIDNSTFAGYGSATQIYLTAMGPGLIDHNTFTGLNNAIETVHNQAWAPGVLTGWQDAITPGAWQAIYFEDNVVTGVDASVDTNLVQTYYGGRTVVRHNTFNHSQVDYHGSNTQYAARWFEVSNNDFNHNGIVCIRGGSGFVFNNTSSDSSGTIFFEDDTWTKTLATGGADYGTGRGQNNSHYPAYYFGNTGYGVNFNSQGCSVVCPDCVISGWDVKAGTTGTVFPATCTVDNGASVAADFFWRTDQGLGYKCTQANPAIWALTYTPLTYPYPLDANGLPNPTAASCSSPSKLTFIGQPSNASTGANLGAVSIAVQDSGGVTCNTATNSIALSKHSGATWGTLNSSSSLTKSAVNGVANFSDLSITGAAGSGSIDAKATSLTDGVSQSITITAACVTPTKVVITSQPTSPANLGDSLGTLTATIKDGGDLVCTSATNTITLSKDTGATWGTLNSTGGLAKSAVAGIASWNDLSVTGSAGTGSIDATAGGLTPAVSSPLTISSCYTIGVTWASQQFSPAQSGSFTASFDATPSGNTNQSVLGLGGAVASDFTNLATIVEFNTDGIIYVRNGANYTHDATVSYNSLTSYHFRMPINFGSKTYSVFVTPAGGTETQIANNYGFRSDWVATANLQYFSGLSSSGSVNLCNESIGQTPTSSHGRFSFFHR